MKYKSSTLFLTLFYSILNINSSQCQTVYYVDSSIPDNSGNGLSWVSAKKDLQNAIKIANTGDEIWVKAGIYRPTETPYQTTDSPRNFTFYLKSGLSIYGGFLGIETLREQRDFVNNTTILSGDIGLENYENDNCFHVILASASSGSSLGVTIDGFTIKGGYSNSGRFINLNGNDIFDYGGGIAIYNGRNNISNNIIMGCSALMGGGLYMIRGQNTVFNNKIIENKTLFDRNGSGGYGGGLYTQDCSSFVNSNLFTNNLGAWGAAVSIYNGNNQIENNTIKENIASNSGGGIYMDNGVNSIKNNFISKNSAYDGAGLNLLGNTTTLLNKNIISENNASNLGGGIYTYSANLEIYNNLFVSNSALRGGGILSNATTSIINNTFVNNRASVIGGGLFMTYANFTLFNNIFWNNKRDNQNNLFGADVYDYFYFSNSDIRSNFLQLSSENYNIGPNPKGNLFLLNPQFQNINDFQGPDNIFLTADDGLQIQTNSPAKNSGNVTLLPTNLTTDITGSSRIQENIVDMGAYEFKKPCPTSLSIPTGEGNSGVFLASGYIQSSATVANPTTYSSSKAITLNPGFQVITNRNFTAIIEGCTN